MDKVVHMENATEREQGDNRLSSNLKRPTFRMPAIKLPNFLQLRRKQLVSNQPLDARRQYHLARTIYTILLSLMISLSVAIISLRAITLSFIEENLDMAFAFGLGNRDSVVLAALPEQLQTAPTKLTIIAGVIALLVGIAHAGFVAADWKKGRRTQSHAFKRNAIFMHITNSILVLFALVSVFVSHKSTSHFRQDYIIRQATNPYLATLPSDPTDGIRYNIGRFDLETWSCELKDIAGVGMARMDYAQQCGVERAGRLIMIPLVIAALLVVGLSIQQLAVGRRDVDGGGDKTEDVELEMGRFNAV